LHFGACVKGELHEIMIFFNEVNIIDVAVGLFLFFRGFAFKLCIHGRLYYIYLLENTKLNKIICL